MGQVRARRVSGMVWLHGGEGVTGAAPGAAQLRCWGCCSARVVGEEQHAVVVPAGDALMVAQVAASASCIIIQHKACVANLNPADLWANHGAQQPLPRCRDCTAAPAAACLPTCVARLSACCCAGAWPNREVEGAEAPPKRPVLAPKAGVLPKGLAAADEAPKGVAPKGDAPVAAWEVAVSHLKLSHCTVCLQSAQSAQGACHHSRIMAQYQLMVARVPNKVKPQQECCWCLYR